MNEIWFLNCVNKAWCLKLRDWNDDLVVYWKPWNNCPCYRNRLEFLISVAMIWFLMDMMENCWLDSCWRIWIYGSCEMMNITGMILVMYGMIDGIKCRKWFWTGSHDRLLYGIWYNGAITIYSSNWNTDR